MKRSGPRYSTTHLIHHIFLHQQRPSEKFLIETGRAEGVWLDSKGTSETRQKKREVWLEPRLATDRTGWNRCLPVQCCGFKQTLVNAHAYTHVFIIAHTGSACFCFVGQAPQFLRSKRASATHTVTHCLCCRASCGLTLTSSSSTPTPHEKTIRLWHHFLRASTYWLLS